MERSGMTQCRNFFHGAGANTVANGNTATALGFYLAESYQTVIGRYNTDYTPTSTTSWDANDRLFVIGNGMDSAFRADALVMLKNSLTRR